MKLLLGLILLVASPLALLAATEYADYDQDYGNNDYAQDNLYHDYAIKQQEKEIGKT